MEEKKYFVGRFSLSDHKAVLNVTGYVEKAKNYIDSLFFFSLNPHNGQAINIKLNSIEMRALANAIEHIAYQPKGSDTNHTKESGASNTKSTLTISSNEKYHYVGIAKGNLEPVQVSFKDFELLALSQELKKLIDEVVSSTYKTQRHIERKKEEALRLEDEKKELENAKK